MSPWLRRGVKKPHHHSPSFNFLLVPPLVKPIQELEVQQSPLMDAITQPPGGTLEAKKVSIGSEGQM